MLDIETKKVISKTELINNVIKKYGYNKREVNEILNNIFKEANIYLNEGYEIKIKKIGKFYFKRYDNKITRVFGSFTKIPAVIKLRFKPYKNFIIKEGDERFEKLHKIQ